MAGHNDLHPHTLPHVRNRIRIDGEWPSPITLTNGWSRATARPWNDETPNAFVRLERGTGEFLTEVTHTLGDLSGGHAVYSPAVYPQASRLWRRCGYVEAHLLDIMERATTSGKDKVNTGVAFVEEPDWDMILEIDRAAFDGFWGMSREGLEEALASTRRSAVLGIGEPGITGYALVGAQWGVSYLQRIAVHPAHTGKGSGSALVRAALRWGRSAGAKSMVLNVRADNNRAHRMYRKEGFMDAGTPLSILRYEN